MKNEEHHIQKQIVRYLRGNGIFVFAVPNGVFFNAGKKSFAYINKLKAEGFLDGVSDLIIGLPGGITVYIEVKSPSGRQRPKQKQFEIDVKRLGFKYEIWRDLRDAERFLKEIS